MMAPATFDTLKFVETLEASGIPTGQAKAISTAVKDSCDEIAADVATKRDIADMGAKIDKVESGLNVQIDNVESRLEAKIDRLELKLTIKMGAMLVVMIGVLSAILRMPM